MQLYLLRQAGALMLLSAVAAADAIYHLALREPPGIKR